MKKIQLVFLFLCLSLSLSAQITLDNNPASLKWYQINSPNFNVIFPKGFEEQAQRMANTLELIHVPEAKTMGDVPKRLNVVLQNQSSISNGFVTITPRRSEFFTMPSQNYNFLGTNDWLNLLASHEYRHVVQYQHANRGFSRALYYLFGSNTLAAMAHIGAPNWFWEGDAVATETAFTHSGRGRIPYFNLVFKTNLLEGRTFNYHKQYLRSYKHNIPDHYVLGFNMVSYLRKRTNDPEIWEKITARSWNVPFIPFTFSNAIKKETGLYVTQLYKEMAADLKKEWQKEIDQLQLTPFEKVNSRKNKAYTDYLYPQPLEDGSVLAMKDGIGDIEQFVIIKDGNGKRIFTPGIVNETGMLSTTNTKVVWNEYGYDPRWGIRNYSLLKIYDFKSKKRKKIGSRRERFAGAALSPDGIKVATVRTDNAYKTTLVVLDVSSGNVIKEFANPDNNFISMPRWTSDGKIIALRTVKSERAVSLFDFSSGNVEDLLQLSRENIGHPVMVDKFLLYNSPVTGIDNIFAYDTVTKMKYQITASKYGAYNPAISKDGRVLYYNEQGRDGMDVVKTSFDPSLWKQFEVQKTTNNIAEFLAEQEGQPNLLDSVPQKQFPVKRYSKFKGLINPYSWGAYIDNSLAQATIGISSQDILSTTNINAGYQFDIAERTGLWKAGISYQGWYPIIDVQATHGTRSVSEGKVIFNDEEKEVKFKWTETNIEGGLRIPLTLTQSKFYSNFTFGDALGITKTSDFRNNIDGGGRIIPESDSTAYFYRDYTDKGSLIYNHFFLSAYRLLKTSRRDINSKWGQIFWLDLYNTPLKGDFKGRNFSFYTQLYFPGLFKHHSLWGYWAYQSTEVVQKADNYFFRNNIPIPRGQSVSRFQQFYSMSANYTFPIWYPDVAIGPLVNFQRVRLNAFMDYGYGISKLFNSSQDYISAGAEIKFDLNLMRFLPQFNIGFRYAKGLRPSTSEFEVLIGTIPF
jgi:hypothetical protein